MTVIFQRKSKQEQSIIFMLPVLLRFVKEWDKLSMWKQLGFQFDETATSRIDTAVSSCTALPSLIGTSLETIRRYLHAQAELSGHEKHTAISIVSWLQEVGSGRIITGLGGYGVAGVFGGRKAGPRVMLRAELDALPISEEDKGREWHSRNGHVAHIAIRKQYVAGENVIKFTRHFCSRNISNNLLVVVTMDI